MDREANPNGFERNEQRRIWQGVVVFVTATFCSLLQAMSQSLNYSPFHGHLGVMSTFILAILAYAITQPEFLPQEYLYYQALVFRVNILFGTLVVVSPVKILVPALGVILFVLWLCWFTKEVICVYHEFNEQIRHIAVNLYETSKIYLLRYVGRGPEEPHIGEI